jgi:hypothetical protein
MAKDKERASKRLKGSMGQFFEQKYSTQDYHRNTTAIVTPVQGIKPQQMTSKRYLEMGGAVTGGSFAFVEDQGAQHVVQQNAIQCLDPVEQIEVLSHRHGFKTRWMIFDSNHAWPRQITVYLRLERSTDSEDTPRIEVFKSLARDEKSGKKFVAMQAIAWIASGNS